MRKRKLWLGLIVLLIGVGLVVGGCGGGKEQAAGPDGSGKITLKIGYLPITHSLPLVVSHKLDNANFKNVNVEPVKFSSWPELTEALNSGQIQGAITMSELAMASYEKGIPTQMQLLSHRNGDFLTVKNEINSLADLKGKTVAIPHRLSGHNILLYKALKEAGIKYEEINWIEMPPPDMMGALNRGEVDGYIVAEPFGTQAVKGGQGKVLLKANDIWPDWICCGLVLNQEFIKQNPEAAQEFMDSFVKAGRYIDQNRAEAVKIAQEYMNIKSELWEESLKYISYSNLKPEKEEFAAVQDYLVEMGLLQGKVNIDELVADRYAVKAYEKVK
ncbi:ABC transporter substrate-binding protein [Zhaonella formicivorans]|uniref:ABC transporter substrate-binding protein n=1 Tax=Zhaonella formicivorans TaxID=2528593 RepID=UPI0010DD99A0|nr:ABC transporter substrate-binding protein [Zhaonella formicivorans]